MGAVILGLIGIFLPILGFDQSQPPAGTTMQGPPSSHAPYPGPSGSHGTKPGTKPPGNGQRPPNGSNPNNRYNNYGPQVIIDANAMNRLLATPAPVHTPKAHPTKRPANAPEVFSSHSSDE